MAYLVFVLNEEKNGFTLFQSVDIEIKRKVLAGVVNI